MALPGVKVAIFLERLVVRNAAFHTLSKISNGRNNRCRISSRGKGRSRSNSGTPNPECIFGKVKPVDSGRRNGLSDHETRELSFLTWMTLRVVSLSVPFLMTQNCIAPYTCGSMDMKSEAQVTPASVKQARKVGIVVSVEGMGGYPKSTPRICSKAVASLRVETMMLVVVVVVC